VKAIGEGIGFPPIRPGLASGWVGREVGCRARFKVIRGQVVCAYACDGAGGCGDIGQAVLAGVGHLVQKCAVKIDHDHAGVSSEFAGLSCVTGLIPHIGQLLNASPGRSASLLLNARQHHLESGCFGHSRNVQHTDVRGAFV